MKRNLNNNICDSSLQNDNNVTDFTELYELYELANKLKEDQHPDVASTAYWYCLANGIWEAAYPLAEILHHDNYLGRKELAIVLHQVAKQFGDERCTEVEVFRHQAFIANELYKYIKNVHEQKLENPVHVNSKLTNSNLEKFNNKIIELADSFKTIDLKKHPVSDYFVSNEAVSDDNIKISGEYDQCSCIIL